MNGSLLNEETTLAAEVAELRQRVQALEIRLEQIEQGRGGAAPQAQRDTPAPLTSTSVALTTEIAAATVFRRVAMLCFVLLGALILRVLTQQHILNAGFGMLLGFAYAACLIALSLMPGRLGAFARENSLFQCSGVVLAFFIAVESAMRTHMMGRASAMITNAAFALLALGIGIHDWKSALAATGIIGGVLALVALDLQQATVGLQLGLITVLAAAGIGISWRAGWDWLRPVTILMMLLLLPAGLFFCGKEPGVPRGLLAASAGVWSVMMLQHLIAFRRLGRGTVWLPILTLWFAGL